MIAKAGLEHRNYPYDLKRLKFTTFDMIPSLIPSMLWLSYNRQYKPIIARHFAHYEPAIYN